MIIADNLHRSYSIGKKQVEVLQPKALPTLEPSPIGAWISACTKGTSEAPYGIDEAVDAVRCMIAAYTSHDRNGVRVPIES